MLKKDGATEPFALNFGEGTLIKSFVEFYETTEYKAKQCITSAQAVKALTAAAIDKGIFEQAALDALKKKEAELDAREKNIGTLNLRIYYKEREIEKREIEVERISRLEQDLLQVETAEMRDRLRLAYEFRRFVEEIKIETPQNKTKVFEGYAAILAGCPLSSYVDEDKGTKLDSKKKREFFA